MIPREYTVYDQAGEIMYDDDGECCFSDLEIANGLAEAASEEGDYQPYAVTLRVPGPGGFAETRAVSVWEHARNTWHTDVYDNELASA
jgi:hypothetical protein